MVPAGNITMRAIDMVRPHRHCYLALESDNVRRRRPGQWHAEAAALAGHNRRNEAWRHRASLVVPTFRGFVSVVISMLAPRLLTSPEVFIGKRAQLSVRHFFPADTVSRRASVAPVAANSNQRYCAQYGHADAARRTSNGKCGARPATLF